MAAKRTQNPEKLLRYRGDPCEVQQERFSTDRGRQGTNSQLEEKMKTRKTLLNKIWATKLNIQY